MTRRIFDWHPELNIFAEGIPGRMQVYHMKDGLSMAMTWPSTSLPTTSFLIWLVSA
jgi:hypothetical protein